MGDEESMNPANETAIHECPACSKAGIECVGPKKVPEITVSSLIIPKYQDDIPSGPLYFCQDKECEVVYFSVDGGHIRKDQLSVPVWQKEGEKDIPVCYCFDYSARSIMEDVRQNSPPTIPMIIRDKIKAGLCSCDTKNPQGTCCLGNVAYWVKQA